MAGVVNLISRRPTEKPIREFLFNRTSLGETEASPVPGVISFRPIGVRSLLAGGDRQESQDVNGDGWADVAGYGRGVLRPRLFWDNKNGGTAVLTGGITYEDRSGGTIAGLSPSSDGTALPEALKTRPL